MTDIKARQPEGIPAGGQFAPTFHNESPVTLGTAERRPELYGWPESLPEPELKLIIADDCTISTALNVEGHGTITIFTDNPSTGRCDYEQFAGEFDDVDGDTMEQVVAWASERHLYMEADARAEMKTAAEAARARIAAAATGKPASLSDDELADLKGNTDGVLAKARTAHELAGMALFSREILKRHPEAATARLEVVGADNGEFIGGAVITDGDGNRVAVYGEDRHEDENTVTDLLLALDSDAGNAAWSEYTLRAEGFSVASFEEDSYTLNLTKAADWAPGA
ncbi:hypothetical protein [Arthrobacter caoxuetaonis]|uniref:Uncharacterized protein n=1 Tax=Arthrobacter caoxuetaonis TaxID=2886935 RepID=A0A9X1MGM0_9MICC|nr:hypothetical protein [Arthrobacter caoxuetaonis]MCC3299763.1 hypothetical protein [Arthrobacter caoxuetaonis]USQ59336.1 hypothetical protein NF551_17280 [Arthrobacter caoxuetaonis]